MRGEDRYCCPNHVMNGSCANSRGIRRTVLEGRVLAGLRENLMAPEAAAAIRGLVERIVPTPGVAWAETDAKLVEDLGAILEWTGAGDRRRQTSARVPDLSVSVIAGAGCEPAGSVSL